LDASQPAVEEQPESAHSESVAEPEVGTAAKTAEVEAKEPSVALAAVQDEPQESPLIIDDPSLTLEQEEVEEESDEFTNVADSLRVGSWVEIGEEGKDRQRAKLAAIVRATGKYIFVNRIGMKVAERMRAELIEELKVGMISVLDNALLFDRALESVISGLRE